MYSVPIYHMIKEFEVDNSDETLAFHEMTQKRCEEEFSQNI